MTERPIIFQGWGVRAILAGTKTETRRPIKPQPHKSTAYYRYCPDHKTRSNIWVPSCSCCGMNFDWSVRCPYGVPGERLWAREMWRTYEQADGLDGVLYAADSTFRPIEDTPEAAEEWMTAHANGLHGERWRPSIHMPKWASRITLEIAEVRVQRVQDISEQDALAEGVERCFHEGYDFDWEAMTPARANYRREWDRIYTKDGHGWDANRWVWAVTFGRLD